MALFFFSHEGTTKLKNTGKRDVNKFLDELYPQITLASKPPPETQWREGGAQRAHPTPLAGMIVLLGDAQVSIEAHEILNYRCQ